MTTDRTKRLEQTAQAIRERWGTGAFRPLQALAQEEFPHLATGFPTLDRALGIGGLPRGRITELVSAPTSGMHTLALHTIASAQRGGEMAVYIDTGRNFDADYAVRCGVLLDNLLLVRPPDDSTGLNIARDLVASGGTGVLVFDRTSALTTAFANTLKMLIHPLAGSPCALIFLTTLSIARTVSSDPSAGLAMAHEATIGLAVENKRWLRRRQAVSGYRSRVTILKNKLAPPARPVLLTIRLGGNGT